MSGYMLGATIGALFWIAAYHASAHFLERVATRIEEHLGHL